MSARFSSKVTIPIPHPVEPGSISGILEQSDSPGTRKLLHGRKLALILHGMFGLFLACLDYQLFYPEGASNRLAYGDYSRLGYEIDLVIGHSRGAILAVQWLCTTEYVKNVSGFVNISGGLRMQDAYEFNEGTWMRNVSAQGYHLVDLKSFKAKVYHEDFDNYANFDLSMSMVQDKFPRATDVLTIHGLADKTAAVYNALLYAKTLSKRNPGTHSLHLMEHADHIYTGRHAEVIQTILGWWDAHLKGTLQSGIWAGPESGDIPYTIDIFLGSLSKYDYGSTALWRRTETIIQ
ncbi:ectomycorrhiza-regulated esterase [Desarmillaria tabescens]|uniref:Ectomycorrhiza-regulated esterase n=1 Tax=Armillaria tabescens TaxID=1929756 RepID=A0AA39JEX5_ARMTA|nr:ectomycorrhiza-regulated esterase [Desarmillaria tabescens]KAK0441505.1 ectomycorrhiza-regulated esterase [Desarmillaria tabescens]